VTVLGVIVIIGLISGSFSSKEPVKSAAPPTPPKTAAELRQDRINKQFSTLNGRHYQLEHWIKTSMNNPKSYEHVQTRFVDKGDPLLVETIFRGTNAFGGVVPSRVMAKVDLDGRVLEILSQEP
jgi:hypothetical protein